MDFCNICMNLLELNNNKYTCHYCNNNKQTISQKYNFIS